MTSIFTEHDESQSKSTTRASKAAFTETDSREANRQRTRKDREAKKGRAHARHGDRQDRRDEASQPRRGRNQGTTGRGAPEREEQRNQGTKPRGPRQRTDKAPYRCTPTKGEGPTESPNAGDAARTEGQNAPAKKQVGRSSRGYLIDSQKVAAQQHEYVQSLLTAAGIALESPSGQFFCHLIISGLRSRNEDRGLWGEYFVPVHSRLITRVYKAKSGEEVWKPLQAAGLIDVTSYSSTLGRSREYRAKPYVYEAFVGRASRSARACKGYRDLFTGKRTQCKAKSKVQDENGNAYPDLIKGALKALKWGYFDDLGIQVHLDQLEAKRDAAHEQWKKSGEPRFTIEYQHYRDSWNGEREGAKWHTYCRRFSGQKHTPLYREYLRLKRRFINDLSCYGSVLAQEPEETEVKGIYKYRLAYAVQRSGRIGQIGGGLQSCSREMKAAAFTRVPGMRNYDRKSSQPCILIQYFEEAAIDASWLEAYRAAPNAKKECADKAGIDITTWKRCFCALLMGASLPRDVLKSSGSIAGYLLDELGAAGAQAALAPLCYVIAALKSSLEAWHDYLVTDFWETHKRWGGGGPFIQNAAGMRFCAEEIEDEHERMRRMAAFLLQGHEAAYIHHLTILQADYDYTVIANEHDGLVVLGEIPDEAHEQAMKAAGLAYGRLVEKPIC